MLFVINDLSCSSDRTDLGRWSVYAVCDGHGGSAAAKYVRKHLGPVLAKLLPSGNPPPARSDECDEFCHAVRQALVKTFVSLHDAFASERFRTTGTTVSVCLMCDWLMTMANVADSEVFLDLGHSIMEMTNSHKIETNEDEIRRLHAQGADLRKIASKGPGPTKEGDSGRGPLRVWPGGLAMSRSIGDVDSGPLVVATPHIRQIWIPKEGARLVMASDGLWDYMSGNRACRLVHRTPVVNAPKRLLKAARHYAHGFLCDDVSILVLDIMPQEGVDFSERQPSAPAGVLRSLSGYLRHRTFHARLKKAKKSILYADVDGLTEFPNPFDNVVPEICDEPTTQVEVEEEEELSRISSASENWDLCECSWDCTSEAYVTWEKDDRDILDTAQSYVTGSSLQDQRSHLKMTMTHPLPRDIEKSEPNRDLLDTSMSTMDALSMTTNHELEDEDTPKTLVSI